MWKLEPRHANRVIRKLGSLPERSLELAKLKEWRRCIAIDPKA